MRTILAPTVLALMLGSGLQAQTSKKTTGPTPPVLSEPGVAHPMPIPENDPASPPNVRKPVHETGREKAVSSRSRKKQSTTRTRTQTKPEASPKVEQNGQVGGAQDPTRRKATEKGQTSESQKP
jgi:hypothetical protein